MKVATLLSLLKESTYRLGRRDVRIWSSNLRDSVSCKAYFRLLSNPTPFKESIFYVVWRIKIPKKVRLYVASLAGSAEHLRKAR